MGASLLRSWIHAHSVLHVLPSSLVETFFPEATFRKAILLFLEKEASHRSMTMDKQEKQKHRTESSREKKKRKGITIKRGKRVCDDTVVLSATSPSFWFIFRSFTGRPSTWDRIQYTSLSSYEGTLYFHIIDINECESLRPIYIHAVDKQEALYIYIHILVLMGCKLLFTCRVRYIDRS